MLLKSLFYVSFLILSVFSIEADARSCETNSLILGDAIFQVELSRVMGTIPSQKSILILPPTGGTNYIDRSYAKLLCKSGFDIYIINKWTDWEEYSLELEIHQRFYRRGQSAIELVLNEIKSPFIGLLGTSVGAEHAAVAASNFKRIDSVFIIVGGAPISKILSESSQEILVEGRKARFLRYGFKSIEEYERAIDKVFTLDPFKMKKLFLEKDLGMVISEGDTMVPAKYQEALQQLWKPRTLVRLSTGHFFSILKTWFCHSSIILNHFNQGATKKLFKMNSLKERGADVD